MRIRGCNQALLDLLGARTEHAVIGNREETLIASEALSDLDEIDRNVFQTGTPQHERELTVFTADGTELHLEVSRIPLASPSGHTIGILVIYEDLTRLRQAVETVALQKADIEERAKAIEFDLDSAEQIQKFLMGRKAEPCPFLDIAFDYRYMEKVGGDYLSFRSLNDGTYSILLADLTGHGVTAALFMALLKYVSQETPEEVRALPAYFFNYLDMEFYEQIPNGFFTAFSASASYIEDSSSVKIEYATAAHPASIVVRSDGSIETLESGDFAIGLLDLVERNAHSLTLAPGDRLYAYTDGFIESRSPDGEEYGFERLCETLASFRDLPLKQSIESAYAAISDYAQSDVPQDDLTIYGIEAKPREEAPEMPTSEEDVWNFN